MSRILRLGALDSETLQHTNKRLQINILPSEPRPKINDKIDVKMVRKKNYGFLSEEGSIFEFFPEIFVCLPFSFSTLAFEKRSMKSAETGQNDKPIIEFLSLRKATQL